MEGQQQVKDLYRAGIEARDARGEEGAGGWGEAQG